MPNLQDHYEEELEHDTSDMGCWCNPKMEYVQETDCWVIVHNSLKEKNATKH